MKKETTLISLSLAGAIGYYLYSKLVKAGLGQELGATHETALERTNRELAWRPQPNVEEPSFAADLASALEVVNVFEDETPQSTVVEDVVAEEVVEEVVEEVHEPVTLPDDYAVEEVNTDPVVVEEPVVPVEDETEEVVEDEDPLIIPVLNFDTITPPVSEVDKLVAEAKEEEVSLVGEFDALLDDPAPVIPETEAQICDACGSKNGIHDKFCNNCGAKLSVDPAPTATPVVEEAPVADPFATPVLDFAEVNFDTPVIETPALTPVEPVTPVAPVAPVVPETEEIITEIIAAPPVVEPVAPVAPVVQAPASNDLDLDGLDDVEDTNVDDAFNAVSQDEKLMDNVEPLHKIDQKDESAKQEFKSIMDFFNTL